MTHTLEKCTNGAVSNTALESQTDGLQPLTAIVDWLSLSFQISGKAKLDKLIDCIRDLLNVDIFFDTYRIRDDHSGRYQAFSGTLGLSFCYTSFDSNDVCNARITLPGQLLAERKPWHIKRVMRRFRDDWNAKCTRIDLAVDDYAKQLKHKQIELAAKRRQGIGFRSGKTVDSYGTNNDGITVYCGSRRSAVYARFYQKGDFDRFEIEYKQSLAGSIFADYLLDSTPDSSELLSSIIRTSISFARKPDANLERSVELSWWVKFRDRIVGTNHKLDRSKPRPSLDRTLKWIHRSVSKALLLMREAVGDENMTKLLELWEYEARGRCNQYDCDRLLQFKLNQISLSDLMSVL